MIYASQARFLSLLTDFYSAQKSVEANGCHGNMRGKISTVYKTVVKCFLHCSVVVKGLQRVML